MESEIEETETSDDQNDDDEMENKISTDSSLQVQVEEDRRFGLEEDLKNDFLFRMKITMNETFDNTAPHGITSFDPKSISQDRRPTLDEFKMKFLKENYQYLKEHPEIDSILALFLGKVLKVKPENPIKFASEYFTQKGISSKGFESLIQTEGHKLSEYRTACQPQQDQNDDENNTSTEGDTTDTIRKVEKRNELVNQLKRLNLGPISLDFDVNSMNLK